MARSMNVVAGVVSGSRIRTGSYYPNEALLEVMTGDRNQTPARRINRDCGSYNRHSCLGRTDHLLRLSQSRVSKVPGGGVLCKRRNSVLLVSRARLSAALRDQLCADA